MSSKEGLPAVDIASIREGSWIRGFKSKAAADHDNKSKDRADGVLQSSKAAAAEALAGMMNPFRSASASSPDVHAKRQRLKDDEDEDEDEDDYDDGDDGQYHDDDRDQDHDYKTPSGEETGATTITMTASEAKRWRRVMANRRSAKESRERKKMRLAELESTVTRLDARKAELESENGALRARVEALTRLNNSTVIPHPSPPPSSLPAPMTAAALMRGVPDLAVAGAAAAAQPDLQSQLLLLLQQPTTAPTAGGGNQAALLRAILDQKIRRKMQERAAGHIPSAAASAATPTTAVSAALAAAAAASGAPPPPTTAEGNQALAVRALIEKLNGNPAPAIAPAAGVPALPALPAVPLAALLTENDGPAAVLPAAAGQGVAGAGADGGVLASLANKNAGATAAVLPGQGTGIASGGGIANGSALAALLAEAHKQLP